MNAVVLDELIVVVFDEKLDGMNTLLGGAVIVMLPLPFDISIPLPAVNVALLMPLPDELPINNWPSV